MKTKRRALITGISGQDGSYLAELLLARNYEVFGLTRPGHQTNIWRIAHLRDQITLVPADLLAPGGIEGAIGLVGPHEIYNLAAVSSIGASWDQPALTKNINTDLVVRTLTALRALDPTIRFCQASSAEIFGSAAEVPQRETTPLQPANPYAEAKAAAHLAVIEHRKQHGLFAVCGILFNHESPRRGMEFVSRKVTDGVARIALGRATELALGSLDAHRDWGFAGDYMQALWLMLQQAAPDDYVIATGEDRSVRELVEIAFAHVGLDWRHYVRTDPAFVRPPEQSPRIGDAARARRELGWAPTVDFPRLVRMMVDADLDRLRRERGR